MKLFDKIFKRGNSNVDGERSEDLPQTPSAVQYRKWRLAGMTVQIVLFISNGGVWVSIVIGSLMTESNRPTSAFIYTLPQIISILAIVGGFIVGLNTRTINIRVELLDLTVTTPATIFVTYGLIIVLASILGCFTATGGNIWITIGVGMFLTIPRQLVNTE